MATKKNWFETIRDRVPDTKFEIEVPRFNHSRSLAETLFGEPFDFGNINVRIPATFDEFMDKLGGFGFQDHGDHYELTTNLGGQITATGTPDDAVKVELTGKDNRTLEITYEYSTSEDEELHYSHSQKTRDTLPDDADEDTIKAYFDEDDNVVVSVEKKKPVEDKGNTTRTIPVTRNIVTRSN